MRRPLQSVRHRGYVLLLTLVLLALVAASLAAVARRSHQASLEATRQEREAQRKWLTTSADTLLPHAEALIGCAAADTERDVARGTVRFDIDLGHHRVQLTLADEQAKANLNTLWSGNDPAVFRVKAEELAVASHWSHGVNPRPLGSFEATAAGSSIDWPAFVSFEQLLPALALRSHLNQPGDTDCILDSITLWGDGRLRWDRANPQVLDAVLTPLLSPSQVAQLVEEDARDTGFASLELTDRQIERLTPLITEASKCHSARLRFDDGRRVRTTLLVLDQANDDQPSTTRLNW